MHITIRDSWTKLNVAPAKIMQEYYMYMYDIVLWCMAIQVHSGLTQSENQKSGFIFACKFYNACPYASQSPNNNIVCLFFCFST